MRSSEMLVGLNILVVEDEIMVGMMLEDMLIDFGCRVVGVVPSIEAALNVIRSRALDGVLLDMNLHGQRPTIVADELASRSVPFLLVTGYGSDHNDPPVLEAAPRLQKPFTQDDLSQRMRETFVTGTAG